MLQVGYAHVRKKKTALLPRSEFDFEIDLGPIVTERNVHLGVN